MKRLKDKLTIIIFANVQTVMTLAKKKSKVCPRIRNFNINGSLILLLVNAHILAVGCWFLLKGMECFAGYVTCMIHCNQQQAWKYGILLQTFDIDKKLFDFIFTVLVKMQIQCTMQLSVQKKWKRAHISYRKNNQKRKESMLCMKISSLWYIGCQKKKLLFKI